MQNNNQNFIKNNQNTPNGYTTNSQNFGYSYSIPTKKIFKGFNGMEFLVILIGVVVLIGIMFFGFLAQSDANKDRQKEFDMISTLIPALDNFYQNSSFDESTKFYPKSVCSSDPNEVDYEFSLREILSGQIKEIDNFEYISNPVFPKDKWGEYAKLVGQKKTKYRCPNLLTQKGFDGQNPNFEIYKDFSSCDFSKASFRRCYLYSSNTGDQFKIGYYSEVKKCFKIFSKYKNQNMKTEIVC